MLWPAISSLRGGFNRRRKLGTPARTFPFILAVLFCGTVIPPDAQAGGRDVLFVADADYPPLNYLDHGTPKGLCIDVIQAMSKVSRMGMTVNLMDWTKAQEMVRRADADALGLLAVSDERRAIYEFTDTVMTLEYSFFVRSGQAQISNARDLQGRTVGVTAGGYPRVALNNQPGINLVVVKDYEDGLRKVRDGSIQALAADKWVALYYLQQQQNTNGVTILSPPFAVREAAFAVRKGDIELRDELNRALKELRKQGVVDDILQKWSGKQVVFITREALRNTITTAATAASLVLLVLLAFWVFTLRRQIAERKQSEEFNRRLIDSSADSINVLDLKGTLLSTSEGGQRLFEIADISQYLGVSYAFLWLQSDRKTVAEAIAAAAQGGRGHFHAYCPTAQGTPKWWDVVITPILKANGDADRLLAVARDVTERKKFEETIWQQANIDGLTGLPNRQLLHDRLAQEIKKTQRAGQTLAALFIDLDNFKDVNDVHGHSHGDALLREATQRISDCVRESDTVARLGGDEFTVVLPGLTDTLRVDRITQNILQTLQVPFLIGDEYVFISASIGIALYPDDASDIESLLKNADQAMYQAKSRGRNTYCYYVPAMQEAAQARQRLIRDLRIALAQGQLSVHYQPILELTTGRTFKAEALLRWQHPERGMVSPIEFIPLAEETGLIHEIGDWVFREAARSAKRWQDSQQASATIQISVNKSPRQFVMGDTATTWVAYLDEIDLPPSCVAIEITEGLLLDTRKEVTERLLQLRDGGVQISLDDFGTGYSAMAYLKKFPIDFLKIDKSFIRDMATDRGDQAIVEAIIVMAHKLGLKVIAEGVETQEQRALLLAAGCDFGQGYLFAKPMPEADFEELLASEPLT